MVRPTILGSEKAFCWAKRYNHLLELMLESGPRPGCKDKPSCCLRGREDRCLTKKKCWDEAGGCSLGGTWNPYDVPAVFWGNPSVTYATPSACPLLGLGINTPTLQIQKKDAVRSARIPKDDQPLK